MQSENLIATLKNDVVFKSIFGNKQFVASSLSRFVSDLLEIPRGSIKSIQLLPTVLAPEFRGRKVGVLDMLLDVDGRTVNIEVQLKRQPDFNDRTLFYWARLYYGELSAGNDYSKAKQTICVNIVDFDLFGFNDYHTCFEVRERSCGELLTEKLQIHFFELKKLEKYRRQRPVEQWLDLFNAETEGDLMSITKTTDIPEVGDTAVKIMEFNAEDTRRFLKIQEEIREMDEMIALRYARQEGVEEGLEQGVEKGSRETLVGLVKKGLLTVTQAAQEADMTEAEFEALMGKSG